MGLYGFDLQTLENNISRLGWDNSSPMVMDVRGYLGGVQESEG